MFGKDFCDENGIFPSLDDGFWLGKVASGKRKTRANNLEISLPYRESDVFYPHNYFQIYRCFVNLG